MKLPRMVIGAPPSLLSLVNAQPKNISPKDPPSRLPCRHLNQIDEGLGLNSGQRAAIMSRAGDYLQLEPLEAARQMLQDARGVFPLDAIRRQELIRRLQEFYLSNREARPRPLFGRPDLYKATLGELAKAMGTQLGLFPATPPAAAQNRPPGYFPVGEERKRINAAIDELIGAMRTDKHFEKSLRAMAGYASDFAFLGENFRGEK